MIKMNIKNFSLSRSAICYLLSGIITVQILFLLIHNRGTIREKSKDILGSFRSDRYPSNPILGILKPSKTPSKSTKPTAFPHKIWQTSKESILTMDNDARKVIQSWSDMNPGWRHEVLTQSGGSVEFITQSYKDSPDIVQVFTALEDTILKADMIRYLALFKHGGFYSDLDTVCLKPIDEWIPEHSRTNTSIVVGVEYDILDSGRWSNWTRDLQFTTWALLAKAGHPLLKRTVDLVMKRLIELTVTHNTTLSQLQPTYNEVLDTTGPAMFTDSVFEYLSEGREKPFTWKDISNLKEPLWIGDVLILPINAFGCGQRHSNSKDCDGNPNAYVHHLFRGSWKNTHKDPADHS